MRQSLYFITLKIGGSKDDVLTLLMLLTHK